MDTKLDPKALGCSLIVTGLLAGVIIYAYGTYHLGPGDEASELHARDILIDDRPSKSNDQYELALEFAHKYTGSSYADIAEATIATTKQLDGQRNYTTLSVIISMLESGKFPRMSYPDAADAYLHFIRTGELPSQP